jgi:hypothetical protein
MRTNVVLVDFENVQPESLEALAADHYRVIVFVGATQTKVPIEIVSATQRMGERAEYVKIAGSGHNALDFHIAFYIGQIAAKDPKTFFHVISKDTGFDPLIQYLMTQHIYAARSASIEEMPRIKPSDTQAATERARVLAQNLRQPKATKPRTDESLAHHIAAQFANQQLSVPEIRAIINALRKQGAIAITDGKVSYSL